MSQYQAEAIVLAIKDWRGADKIVVLFTREYGKIPVVAYGLRQPKSRLSGCVQLFSHIDVIISSGKGLDVLRQCSLNESNRQLREDLTKTAYAALVVEATAQLWPERDCQAETFELLVIAMKLLRERNPRLAAIAICWRLLSLAGYCPELSSCVLCGSTLDLSAFDIEAGGLCCSQCRTARQIVLNTETALLLMRLVRLNLLAPESFTTNSSALVMNERLLLSFMTHCLDKPLQSALFIDSLG